MQKLTGGCACGQVRYDLAGEPGFSFHCCCRSCQRVTGGGHASLFVAPVDQLTTTGELGFFERRAETGNTVRSGFCPSCGSPVLSANSGHPDVRYLHAATLDDPGLFVPTQVVWTSERQPWDPIDLGPGT